MFAISVFVFSLFDTGAPLAKPRHVSVGWTHSAIGSVPSPMHKVLLAAACDFRESRSRVLVPCLEWILKCVA